MKKREIDLNQANCTQLSWEAPVQLKKSNKSDVGNGFLIEAFTGEVIPRWWGTLAIDIQGIQARKSIPVLMNHSSGQIVGHSTDTYKEGSFYVEGQFSGVTEEAKKVKGLADEGFPWQASIGVRALKVLSLEKNASMVVNGISVDGPADVWIESEVFETSFVPLGADSNTSIARFSRFKEKAAPEGDSSPDNSMENNSHEEEYFMEFTIENLKVKAPELLEKIKADAADEARKEALKEGLKQGAEIERKRIQEVMAQDMPGHDALIQKLAFDGKTTGPEAAVQILAAERQIRTVAQENLEADAIAPVNTPAADPTQTTNSKTVTAENFSQHRDLYEEFNGSFEMYEAYQDALKTHEINILGGKR